MVSLEFFLGVILPAALWTWGRPSLQQKWVPGKFSGGWRRPVRGADNLTTFTCWLYWNLGAPSFWKAQGLSRPVQGLLCMYHSANWFSLRNATYTNKTNSIYHILCVFKILVQELPEDGTEVPKHVELIKDYSLSCGLVKENISI